MKQIKIKLSQIEGHHRNFHCFSKTLSYQVTVGFCLKPIVACVWYSNSFHSFFFFIIVGNFGAGYFEAEGWKITINLFNSHNHFVIFLNNLLMIATDPSGFIALILLYLVLKFAFTVFFFIQEYNKIAPKTNRPIYPWIPFFVTTSLAHFQFIKAFVQFFKQKLNYRW